MRTARHGQRGFSLLETLVAFSILAISLGVLLRIFGGGAYMTGKADEHARAVAIAESLLSQRACESCKLPVGGSSGEFDESFRWSIQVSPFPMDDGGPQPLQKMVEPVWVDVNVEWGEADAPQSFSLGTLRLQSKQNGLGGIGQ